MPRQARPHLYLDRTRATWCIRDGARSIRTGCRAGDKAGAEKRLGEYLASKYRPSPSPSPRIGDVLLAYLEHRPKERHCLNNLRPYWGALNVADINAVRCREYAKGRPPVAARRDLEVLRAATNHWDRDVYPLERKPTIVLPQRPAARTRYLSRSDVARLLWAGRRTKHLVRFILLAHATGTRSGALLDLRWDWIDLKRGIMHRREPGTADTKTKRRPPVKLGHRIMAHVTRWRRMDGLAAEYVIHYNGARVRKLRRSWATACRAAGVVASPHDLRRTRATILMSAGADPVIAAAALGMSLPMYLNVYGQHHPDFQKGIADVDR
jgi:integrase